LLTVNPGKVIVGDRGKKKKLNVVALKALPYPYPYLNISFPRCRIKLKLFS